MQGQRKTTGPLKVAAVVTAAYVYWAFDAPTDFGDGGYLFWAPVVFVVAWAVCWVFTALFLKPSR